MSQKIGIVTVLYNCESVVEEFFQSLNHQSFRNFILYVVDNNSTDKGLELSQKQALDSWFQTVFIPEQENWGIAKGNNLGIERALADGCDLVLLANNDIEFGPETLSTLVASLDANHCDMIVPKITFYGTNLIWCAGGTFGYKKANYHYHQKHPDSHKSNVAKYVEYSPTCFMLIRRQVFEKVGMMDEKYFVYFDDTDFIWRAVKQNGMSLYYEPKALVQHKVSVSTKNAGKHKTQGKKKTLSMFQLYYHHRNSAYFMNKYFPWYRRWCVYAYQTGHYFLRTVKHPHFPSVLTLIGYYREGIKMYHEWRDRN